METVLRPYAVRVLVLLTALTVVTGGCVVGWAGAVGAVRPPPGDTVVEVTGNAADGFTIRHYDGTVDHPPTDSEARAECGEYDARVARVRCRVHVRTWYRDLADLRQALAYAHRQ